MNETVKISNNLIIKTIHGERFTPFSLCKKLKASALLESASFWGGKSRFSIILEREAFKVFQIGTDIYLEIDDRIHKLRSKVKDVLELVYYFSSQHKNPGSGFPFPAGGIGYIGYEYCRFFDEINLDEKPDETKIPDALFIFGHTFLIFDHFTDTITLLGLNYKEHSINLEKAIEELERRLHDLDFNYLYIPEVDYPSIPLNLHSGREKFIRGVEKVRREIIKGNLLQGVLSNRIKIRTEIPALEAYRKLRSLNPSPYMFYIDCKRFQLFGSSPEVHIKVKGKKATIRPIAGTRRRGKTPEEDKKLEEELLNDEKEVAEHLMLIDLARNDLGRVCKPGSVEVTEYMGIENYSHVMHIVSQVDGELDSEKTGLDALRMSFPAGTVSGAPKIRAIEIINKLEEVKRGFYAGIVGYFEPGGTLDTCITIRSALKIDDILYLQAGAGVVYDSKPEREYEETCEKLRALCLSLGIEI